MLRVRLSLSMSCARARSGGEARPGGARPFLFSARASSACPRDKLVCVGGLVPGAAHRARGFAARVLVARDARRSVQLVLKKIRLDNVSPKERAAAHQEVKLLSQLNHPNVLGYIDSFMHKNHLCIITELCERGDLYNALKSCKKYLSEDQVLDWFVQIALAMQHIHQKKVLHRDLKTQNVFLTADGLVKLGDFGIARVLNAPVEMAMTVIGTPYYMSPEVMESRPYDFKSDMWSLGCVLYEMTSLKHAFDANDMNGLVMKIVRGKFMPTPSHYSTELRSLVNKLLTKIPKQRPTLEQILEMPFLRKRVEALQAKNAAQAAENHARLESARELLRGPGSKPVGAAAGKAGPPAAAERLRLEREIRKEREQKDAVESNIRALQERRQARAGQARPGGGRGDPRRVYQAAMAGVPVGGRGRGVGPPRRPPGGAAAAAPQGGDRNHRLHERNEPNALQAAIGEKEDKLARIQREREKLRQQAERLEAERLVREQQERQQEREREERLAQRERGREPERAAAAAAAAVRARGIDAEEVRRSDEGPSRRRPPGTPIPGAGVRASREDDEPAGRTARRSRADEAVLGALSEYQPTRRVSEGAAGNPGGLNVSRSWQGREHVMELLEEEYQKAQRVRRRLDSMMGELGEIDFSAAGNPPVGDAGEALRRHRERRELSSSADRGRATSGPADDGSGDRVSHVKAARERRREEENRRREAELLEARKQYFEERRQAAEKNRAQYESHADAPKAVQAAPSYPPRVHHERSASGGSPPCLDGVDNDSSDEDEHENEADLQRLRALQATIAERIDHLQATLQVAAAADPDDAEDASYAELEQELEEPSFPAHDVVVDRKVFESGKRQDRVQALRGVCEKNLGPTLLEKLCSYLRERSRMLSAEESVTDESVFRAELRERLGPERFQYVALIDRLLFEEEQLAA